MAVSEEEIFFLGIWITPLPPSCPYNIRHLHLGPEGWQPSRAEAH